MTDEVREAAIASVADAYDRYYAMRVLGRDPRSIHANQATRDALLVLATHEDDPDDPGPRTTRDYLLNLPLCIDSTLPDGVIEPREEPPVE